MGDGTTPVSPPSTLLAAEEWEKRRPRFFSTAVWAPPPHDSIIALNSCCMDFSPNASNGPSVLMAPCSFTCAPRDT